MDAPVPRRFNDDDTSSSDDDEHGDRAAKRPRNSIARQVSLPDLLKLSFDLNDMD